MLSRSSSRMILVVVAALVSACGGTRASSSPPDPDKISVTVNCSGSSCSLKLNQPTFPIPDANLHLIHWTIDPKSKDANDWEFLDAIGFAVPPGSTLDPQTEFKQLQNDQETNCHDGTTLCYCDNNQTATTYRYSITVQGKDHTAHSAQRWTAQPDDPAIQNHGGLGGPGGTHRTRPCDMP